MPDILKKWNQDFPEFAKLPDETKSKALGNYFDRKISTPEFQKLSPELQLKGRTRFINREFGTVAVPDPAQVPRPEPGAPVSGFVPPRGRVGQAKQTFIPPRQRMAVPEAVVSPKVEPVPFVLPKEAPTGGLEGLPSRPGVLGFAEDVLKSIPLGISRLPEMAAKITRAADIPFEGEEDPVRKFVEPALAKIRAFQEDPGIVLSKEAQTDEFRRSVTQAVQNIIPSGFGMLVGAAIGGVPGAVLGGALPFAIDEFDSTIQEGVEQNKNIEDVLPFALLNGAIEGGGEGLANWLGFKIFGLAGGGALPFKESVKQMLKQGLGSFLKNTIKQLPVEVTTELGQAAGEAFGRQKAGLLTPTPWEAAKLAAGPAAVMTVFFGGGAHAFTSIQRRQIAKQLTDGNANPEARLKAANFISESLGAVDEEAQSGWDQFALQAIQNKTAIPIDLPTAELIGNLSEEVQGDLVSKLRQEREAKVKEVAEEEKAAPIVPPREEVGLAPEEVFQAPGVPIERARLPEGVEPKRLPPGDIIEGKGFEAKPAPPKSILKKEPPSQVVTPERAEELVKGVKVRRKFKPRGIVVAEKEGTITAEAVQAELSGLNRDLAIERNRLKKAEPDQKLKIKSKIGQLQKDIKKRAVAFEAFQRERPEEFEDYQESQGLIEKIKVGETATYQGERVTIKKINQKTVRVQESDELIPKAALQTRRMTRAEARRRLAKEEEQEAKDRPSAEDEQALDALMGELSEALSANQDLGGGVSYPDAAGLFTMSVPELFRVIDKARSGKKLVMSEPGKFKEALEAARHFRQQQIEEAPTEKETIIAGNLKVGDKFKIDEEEVTVKKGEEEGTLVIENGITQVVDDVLDEVKIDKGSFVGKTEPPTEVKEQLELFGEKKEKVAKPEKKKPPTQPELIKVQREVPEGGITGKKGAKDFEFEKPVAKGQLTIEEETEPLKVQTKAKELEELSQEKGESIIAEVNRRHPDWHLNYDGAITGRGNKTLQHVITPGKIKNEKNVDGFDFIESPLTHSTLHISENLTADLVEQRGLEKLKELGKEAKEPVTKEAQKQYELRVEESKKRHQNETPIKFIEEIPERAKKVSTATGKVDRGAGGGIRTLGLGIQRQLKKTGRVDLRGRIVRGSDDIATLGQIYRNPQFETLRIFYVDDKGKILAHEGVTSRKPGTTQAFVKDRRKAVHEMKERMKRLGATGYYMLHNHPSGEVVASQSDANLTSYLNRQVPGLVSHIIIDTNKFSVLTITKTGEVEGDPVFKNFNPEKLLTPEIEHPLLGKKISEPGDIAHLAKDLELNPGNLVLFFLSSRGKLRAIQEVPGGLFKNEKGATDYIRGRMREFGSPSVAMYIPEEFSMPDLFLSELISNGSLMDIVSPVGTRLVSLREQVSPKPGFKAGVKEKTTGFRVAEPGPQEAKFQSDMNALASDFGDVGDGQALIEGLQTEGGMNRKQAENTVKRWLSSKGIKPKPRVEQIKEKIKDRKGLSEYQQKNIAFDPKGIDLSKEGIKNIAAKVYTQFVMAEYPVVRFAGKAGKEAAKQIENRVRARRGKGGVAEDILTGDGPLKFNEDGTTTPRGTPSLQKILAPIKSTEEYRDYETVRISMRDIALSVFRPDVKGTDLKESFDELVRISDKYGNTEVEDIGGVIVQVPKKFNEMSKKQRQFEREAQLDPLLEVGWLSQQAYDKMIESPEGEYYASFSRAVEELEGAVASQSGSPIKRIKGTEKDLKKIPTVESAAANTQKVINLVEQIRLNKSLVDLRETSPELEELIEPVDPNFIPVKQVLTAEVDPKQRVMLKTLTDKLGVTVETLKKLGGRKLGDFQSAVGDVSAEIRLRFATTEKTLSHEIGHAIDDKLGLVQRLIMDGSPKAKKELRFIADTRHAGEGTEGYQKYVRKRGEQVAEFISRYFTRKEWTRLVAPETTASFERILKQNGLGGFLEIGPSGVAGMEKLSDVVFAESPIPPKSTITVPINGKKFYYKVPTDVHDALQSYNANEMSTVIKLMSIPTRLLRAGATLSAEFIARNPVRDQFTAFIYSEYGYNPFVDFPKGFFHLLKKDALFREYQASGAEQSYFTSLDRQTLNVTARDILSFKGRGFKTLNPIEGLRIMSEWMEKSTRLGAFGKARAKGATQVEAMAEARDLTLDFGRIGKERALNQIIAFWNANVQGTDKMVRSFKTRPKETMLKVFASITLPSVLLWAINKDDERYKGLPDWQKNFFWIIPLGDDGPIIRIPKPFELGIIFGSLPERILDYVYKKDPESIKSITEAIGTGAFPGLIPTAGLPIIEHFSNYSFFRGRQLESLGVSKQSAPFRYTPYTPEIAKRVGKLFNISPIIFENYIRNWTGTLGSSTIRYASELFADEAPDVKENWYEYTPAVRGFIARQPIGGGSVFVERFYNLLQEISETEADYKLLLKEAVKGEASKYIKGKGKRLRFAKPARRISKRMAELRRKREGIIRDRLMTPAAKRNRIDAIDRRISQLAKAFVENYKKNVEE